METPASHLASSSIFTRFPYLLKITPDPNPPNTMFNASVNTHEKIYPQPGCFTLEGSGDMRDSLLQTALIILGAYFTHHSHECMEFLSYT